ncbi:hypothetical protein W02_36160 [Nitrospira sp. KM1]|uniref:hypothetical protein n=1 Tax=Nitrospira sp. KM1 TaxID=1936990 RepID=UPI0013A795A8|nr:hypothetical protein [Nitrospira sp. KM1]BCA56476.1 hypothetical protein W02_36160 [Nitrospira sp. KM1]
MARSRRPELEKDNPSAPQTYIGRRKKANGSHSSGHTETIKTLETLTEAAEHFVNRVPRLKKNEAERQALLNAITQAQLVLSVRHVS